MEAKDRPTGVPKEIVTASMMAYPDAVDQVFCAAGLKSPFQDLDSVSGLPMEAGCTTLNAREPSLSKGSDSFTPQVRLACEFLRALILSVERSGGQC